MNKEGSSEKTSMADTEVSWYDFGGGFTVCPTNGLPDMVGPEMAALWCVRSGLVYYKVFEGDFTEKDLPEMFKKYESEFSADVIRKTQENSEC
jgi:hypothetical protein